MRQKLFKLVLSCILVLGLMPSMAFAAPAKDTQSKQSVQEKPLKSVTPQESQLKDNSDTWGTCPWSWDLLTGTITIYPGNPGAKNDAPWKLDELRDVIKNIKFVKQGDNKTKLPEDSSNLFGSLRNLESVNLSGADGSDVIDMTNMFVYCSSLVSLDFSNFNANKITEMANTFSGCSSIKSFNFSGIDTSTVTNMTGLFSGCMSLQFLNLSRFNTAQVTSMRSMFSNCDSLVSVDLSSFNTSKVTNMDSMFNNCPQLTSLDLTSFDTGAVDRYNGMFNNCYALERVVLGKNVTKLSPLPSYEVKGHKDWYSLNENAWMSSDVVATRLGVADTYTKEAPKNIKEVTVAGIVNKTYTGSPITQDLKLTDGNRVLVLNKDYTISYENNINPGTATIIITGIGDYTGSVKKTFTITSAIKPSKPVITVQPVKKTTINEGTTKPFSISVKAKATRGGKLSYQWYSNGKAIKGATKATYTIKNPSALKPGTYNFYCMVTEQLLGGKTTNKSNVSTLTVLAPLSFVQMTPQGKTALTLNWNKENTADGYDVFFSRCNHGTTTLKCKKIKTIKGNKTTTYTKTKLLANTCYKAYVRPFKVVSGKKVYLAESPQAHAYTNGGSQKYSNPKAIALNAAKVGIKAKASFQIKAKITLTNPKKKVISQGHASVVRYVSSDTSVAKVSKTGKIVGVAKGSCTIYAITQNGLRAACKVTVG